MRQRTPRNRAAPLPRSSCVSVRSTTAMPRSRRQRSLNAVSTRTGHPYRSIVRHVPPNVATIRSGVPHDREDGADCPPRHFPVRSFQRHAVYAAMEANYTYRARQLNAAGLVYIHLVDHWSMGAPPVPESMKSTFRSSFTRTLILSGGYDGARAASDPDAGKCDLIAFARPFLANQHLVASGRFGPVLNAPDLSPFYTPGPARSSRRCKRVR
jgi:hypothetical protein